MGLIVKKFGGTSVANTERIFAVTKIIQKTYIQGHKIVVIVSAQGNTTDDLIKMAYKINPNPSSREMDVLISSGEQVSMAILTMALHKIGIPAISLLGWQAGFETCDTYGNAKIRNLYPKRVQKELDKNNVVIIAGFQGINNHSDITTMGRGGSDTSAVAIGAALKADNCMIYTDVDGVYTVDPNIVPEAHKFDIIPFDTMINLSAAGAKVLNKRSVEIGKKFNTKINVLSSFRAGTGTVISEDIYSNRDFIKGIAVDNNLFSLSLTGPNNSEISEILELFFKKNILISDIFYSNFDDKLKIIFLISKNYDSKILNINNYIPKEFNIIKNEIISKISVVGALGNDEELLKSINKILISLKNIKIYNLFIKESTISVVVAKSDCEQTVKLIHKNLIANTKN
ncbi:MAG: aspartate kinase [Candidatus Improbicoccus devescovinae]|nr:MAG: aspartate kinase [Candidatus Improbicoccus devescovinae]